MGDAESEGEDVKEPESVAEPEPQPLLDGEGDCERERAGEPEADREPVSESETESVAEPEGEPEPEGDALADAQPVGDMLCVTDVVKECETVADFVRTECVGVAETEREMDGLPETVGDVLERAETDATLPVGVVEAESVGEAHVPETLMLADAVFDVEKERVLQPLVEGETEWEAERAAVAETVYVREDEDESVIDADGVYVRNGAAARSPKKMSSTPMAVSFTSGCALTRRRSAVVVFGAAQSAWTFTQPAQPSPVAAAERFAVLPSAAHVSPPLTLIWKVRSGGA